MGCFSTCFPKSKRPRSRRPTPCFDQSRVKCFDEFLHATDVKGQENADTLIDSAPDSKDEQTEILNASGRKKVTFDLNVKVCEELGTRRESGGDFPAESSIDEEDESEKEGVKATKEKEIQCPSESSSSSSLPSNPVSRYRYQNCRESDDELDDNDYMGDDDCDDNDHDDDEDDYVGSDEDADDESNGDHQESSFSLSADSSIQKQDSDNSDMEISAEKLNDSTTKESEEDEEEDSAISFNTVLNPVENLSQWESIKGRSSKLSTQCSAKENIISGWESEFQLSEEPNMKASSVRSKNSHQEIAVDTSLSTWLAGPEAAAPTKSRTSSVSIGNSPFSERSGSPRDFDDRPILGALTLEEIRQLKADSTPRRSPNRSPEDMPIIGSVGSYWSPNTQSSKTGFSSTRSKYMEGRRMKLNSTPFEERLKEGA